MKCPSCGADIPDAAGECSFCGSATRTAEAKIEGNASKAETFARIKSSPEYGQRESADRLARLPKITGAQKAIGLAFPIVFIGTSGFIALMALGMSGVFGAIGFKAAGPAGAAISIVPALMALVPMGLVVLGIFFFFNAKKRLASFENDPVEAQPVLIVDKRTQVSGGGRDRSTYTHYYVTCEGEGGGREEYQVWDGKLYGKVSPGDAGVLFERGGFGLDFDRVIV